VQTVSQLLDQSTSLQHTHQERLRLIYLRSAIEKKLADGCR
jgi:hypothetical protein